MTGEARKLQRTAHGEVHRWVKTRLRNEALDCTVYAIFMSHAVGLHKCTEAQWDRLAAKVVTNQAADAPADAGTPPAAAEHAILRRPRVVMRVGRNWATRW